MEARAYLSHLRMTPRKLKIMCDAIRGKNTGNAFAILMNTPKAASEPMLKLLKSAVANAENNHQMNPENLYVAEVFATAGPTMKRVHARARGMSARILKRTSHVTLVVKEKETEDNR